MKEYTFKKYEPVELGWYWCKRDKDKDPFLVELKLNSAVCPGYWWCKIETPTKDNSVYDE